MAIATSRKGQEVSPILGREHGSVDIMDLELWKNISATRWYFVVAAPGNQYKYRGAVGYGESKWKGRRLPG